MAEIKYINNIPVCDKEMRDKLVALKELLDGKTNKIHTHDEYITREELEKNYATKTYVDNKFNEIDDLINNIDLSIYVTKQELESKKYLTSIPDEYITKSELDAMGFITKDSDTNSLATITYVDNKIAELKRYIDDTFALKSDADFLKAWAERLRLEINNLYAGYEELKQRVNDINDINFYYKIVYHLTDVVSSSNNQQTIEKGKAYYSAITLTNNDYTITSAKLTIKGVKKNQYLTITDKVTIDIPAGIVDGDIVITVETEKILPEVPLILCTGISASDITVAINTSIPARYLCSPINCNEELDVESLTVMNTSIAKKEGIINVEGVSPGTTTATLTMRGKSSGKTFSDTFEVIVI